MHVLNVVAKKIKTHRHAGRVWVHVKNPSAHGEFAWIFHGLHALIPTRDQPRRQFRRRHAIAHAQCAVQHFSFFEVWYSLHQGRDWRDNEFNFTTLKRVSHLDALQKHIGCHHAFGHRGFKRWKSHGVAAKILPLGDDLVGFIKMRHGQHHDALDMVA